MQNVQAIELGKCPDRYECKYKSIPEIKQNLQTTREGVLPSRFSFLFVFLSKDLSEKWPTFRNDYSKFPLESSCVSWFVWAKACGPWLNPENSPGNRPEKEGKKWLLCLQFFRPKQQHTSSMAKCLCLNRALTNQSCVRQSQYIPLCVVCLSEPWTMVTASKTTPRQLNLEGIRPAQPSH